jgi:hypothetical protein
LANARCSPKRDHLAPILFCQLPQIFYYRINCTCFRRSGPNEQRSTLTLMVELAVLGLQNPAGAQSPDAFLRSGLSVTLIHIQHTTVTPIQLLPPLPRQPYLQGTRPFGRSYYNVHSYSVTEDTRGGNGSWRASIVEDEGSRRREVRRFVEAGSCGWYSNCGALANLSWIRAHAYCGVSAVYYSSRQLPRS